MRVAETLFKISGDDQQVNNNNNKNSLYNNNNITSCCFVLKCVFFVLGLVQKIDMKIYNFFYISCKILYS